MSVDMTKWQEMAKTNIHNRPAGCGRLAGKITIVTGAAQGFGKGIAEELYNEGATIVIADMNQPLAEQVAAVMGERACEVYTNLNRDLLLAGVALHDIEKLNELNSDENGVVPEYTFEGKMLGHLVMGAASIGARCRELGIGEEKTVMMQHMAISHHYEPEYGSPTKPLFPEAEMLHYLDMTDAKMFDMEDAVKNVEPGGFSDKVFTLDNRKIYKRTF